MPFFQPLKKIRILGVVGVIKTTMVLNTETLLAIAQIVRASTGDSSALYKVWYEVSVISGARRGQHGYIDLFDSNNKHLAGCYLKASALFNQD